MRLLFASLCLAVFAGCPPSTCGPSNCTGCCALDGTCTTGKARLECGREGEACSSCNSLEKCEDGLCVELPMAMDAGVDAGPVTCMCATSCCLPDGSCAPNNDPAACGSNRMFCGTCASGERCELGRCTSAVCTGCFDPLGVCRSGTENLTCGSDGGVCLSCGIDQECQGSRCVFTRCDNDNCRFGCCRPDLSCETSPSVTACGLGGQSCQTCAAMEMCIGGQCI
ncbi:MAG: hypothetical protein QM817_26625 [Archangium sp.]